MKGRRASMRQRPGRNQPAFVHELASSWAHLFGTGKLQVSSHLCDLREEMQHERLCRTDVHCPRYNIELPRGGVDKST